jgi:hypothetical protein
MPARRRIPPAPRPLPANPASDSWRRSKTLEGAVVPEGIDQIIKLEAAYDRMPADALANRWETARRYAGELDAGRSQRETARLVGKDHKHVGWMAEVWREHGGDLGPHKPSTRSTRPPRKPLPRPKRRLRALTGIPAMQPLLRRSAPARPGSCTRRCRSGSGRPLSAPGAATARCWWWSTRATSPRTDQATQPTACPFWARGALKGVVWPVNSHCFLYAHSDARDSWRRNGTTGRLTATPSPFSKMESAAPFHLKSTHNANPNGMKCPMLSR